MVKYLYDKGTIIFQAVAKYSINFFNGSFNGSFKHKKEAFKKTQR